MDIEDNSENGSISEILGKIGIIHPADLPLFYICLSGWMKIQKNRLQILTLQRKLNNYLILYMKKRQRHLRLIEIFNGPKMLCLLEHIRSPWQFQKLFRVKLHTFFKIKEILYTSDRNSSGWLPEIEILLFLFWLSGGLSYKKVEKHLGISEAVLSTMFQSVFDRFLKNVCQVIRFPKDNSKQIGENFKKLTGIHIFGLVMGCLDAFHVSIAFPSQKHDLQYLNDKSEFSIQVQTVCDHRGVLMDIAVGFPGSMLKPHVLQCTPLYLGRFLPPKGYVLLSGRGYPCLQEPVCIIPPFINICNREKKAFNKHQETVHSVLKKSIGQMFDRWRRIFSKPILYPLSDVTNIIIACAMIHNIGIQTGDVWPKKTPVNFSVNEEYLSLVEGQVSGEITQRNIAQHTVPFLMNQINEEFSDSSEILEDEIH